MPVNKRQIVRCEKPRVDRTGHFWQGEDALVKIEAAGRQGKLGKLAENWEQAVPQMLHDYALTLGTRWREAARLEGLERELLLLKNRVTELEAAVPILAPVQTFAPEPYEVLRPFHVVVKAQGDEWVASFMDANLSASGSTDTEAVLNLKDVIAAVFESLMEIPEDNLGPGPAKQLRVLREFVKRTD